MREACAFRFCSRDARSGLVPSPVTPPVPRHIARVHFPPEGPFTGLSGAHVRLSISPGHHARPRCEADGRAGLAQRDKDLVQS